MSFVMIATGATRHPRVRNLSLRQLFGAAAVAALALLGAGAAAGYWTALSIQPAALPALADAAAAEPAQPGASTPFALEQLGRLSGRLFRLESQAAQLSKRIGVLQPDAAAPRGRNDKAGRGATVPVDAGDAQGGPMLPPRAGLDGIGALDEQLARLERQIAAVSDATAQRSQALMRLPTLLPVVGARLASTFGNRVDPIAHRSAFHAGLDFAAGLGTPIRAAAGGRVAFAGFHPDFGRMVEIEHGNGLRTRYAHASKLLVRAGEIVTPGERIAMVGSTGRSTGPHLHFEVLNRGEHVDPRRYLAGL